MITIREHTPLSLGYALLSLCSGSFFGDLLFCRLIIFSGTPATNNTRARLKSPTTANTALYAKRHVTPSTKANSMKPREPIISKKINAENQRKLPSSYLSIAVLPVCNAAIVKSPMKPHSKNIRNANTKLFIIHRS